MVSPVRFRPSAFFPHFEYGFHQALQPPSALCLLVYQGHDATVSFKGPGADDWCTKLTQTDGNWFASTFTAPAAGSPPFAPARVGPESRGARLTSDARPRGVR